LEVQFGNCGADMTEALSDLTILMLDDDANRREKAALLQEQTGHAVIFVDLKDKNPTTEVERIASTDTIPTLAIIDHYLTNAIDIKLGAGVVPALRTRWPGTPVVALTAAHDACSKELISEAYEDIIASEWFSSLASFVPAVVAGYKALTGRQYSLEGLYELLGTPESEIDALKCSLPAELKRSVGDATFPHRVFRWNRGLFYRQPGFLLNRDWTALAIGVSPESFGKYEGNLAGALYSGIFAEDASPRWWKARLYSCLLPDSAERYKVSLLQAAHDKLQVPEEDVSKCVSCGEKWPEVMGHLDEASFDEKDAKPIHLRCSRIDPLAAVVPFYQERRLVVDP
jgi:CheY-like chemotaxis protein